MFSRVYRLVVCVCVFPCFHLNHWVILLFLSSEFFFNRNSKMTICVSVSRTPDNIHRVASKSSLFFVKVTELQSPQCFYFRYLCHFFSFYYLFCHSRQKIKKQKKENPHITAQPKKSELSLSRTLTIAKPH